MLRVIETEQLFEETLAIRHQEAVQLLEETLRIQERVLGPEHPDSLSSRHNLASGYRAVGREKEADDLESKGE